MQHDNNTTQQNAQRSSNGKGPGAAGPGSVSTSEFLPTLADEALYGLPGEITRAIEPHTESHPAALLIQLLIGAGNALGRTPYFTVEGDRHGLNEYGVAVGDTSKARKGTSWGRVKTILADCDPTWVADQIASGLSSGEGLIYRVRDADGDDHGVGDKRLLVLEAEFASALMVMGREKNILSPVLRDAWDNGNLSQLSKNTPLRATDAHVSIIGHITAEELRRCLTATEMANGFANRFLFFYVSRTKLLPRGGGTADEVPLLTKRLQQVLAFGTDVGAIGMDDEAWMIWDAVYEPLSTGKRGLFGATISRAEAHVRRLAAIEAIFDGRNTVGPGHLLAAIAVWQYCEQSAFRIFGDKLGDPAADAVLNALEDAGGSLTQTEINNVFQRHRNKGEIADLRRLLEKLGRVEIRTEETSGRSRMVWMLLPSQISLSSQLAGLVDYLSIARDIVDAQADSAQPSAGEQSTLSDRRSRAS